MAAFSIAPDGWSDCDIDELFDPQATPLDDKELSEFVNANKAANTVKKTRSDLRTWEKWCHTVGEQRKIQ